MTFNFRVIAFVSAILLLGTLIGMGTKTEAEFGRTMSRSEVQAQFAYVYPLPDTDWVSTDSAIAFRPFSGDSRLLYDSIDWQVTGSKSGKISGQSILAEDEKTLIFKPDQRFAHDEQIFVSVEGVRFQFLTTPDLSDDVRRSAETIPPLTTPTQQAPQQAVSPQGTLSRTEPYKTAPDDLPIYDVITHDTTQISDGYVFMGHYDISGLSRITPYLMIVDNNGEPVYYKKLENTSVIDFKRQELHEDIITWHDTTTREVELVDQNYKRLTTYTVGGDYITDWHDFQLEENGNALMLIHDYRLVDMSEIVPGGDPAALVVGCIIRELTPFGNIVFEWRSWDHIPITDSNQDLTNSTLRYMHCNSVEREYDANVMISSRHLDEVTKISTLTGTIMWRLGGPQSDFFFTNDNGFSYQHSARREYDRITIFDNGNGHDPSRSRGVEYIVDEINFTATRVWEYSPDPIIYSSFMGNMQRLTNWNRLIGWGGTHRRTVTEVRGAGQPVWELTDTDSIGGTYRAFRNTWEGYPTWPPTLVAERDVVENSDSPNDFENVINLYFSYNGATEVAEYEIHTVIGGVDSHLTTVPRDGFETVYTYNLPVRGTIWFYVVPVTENGVKLRASGQVVILGSNIPLYLPFITNQ